jgi:hypothetical protein
MLSKLCLFGAAGSVCYPMLEQFALCFVAVPSSICCLQLCLPLSYKLLLNLCTASKLCAAVSCIRFALIFEVFALHSGSRWPTLPGVYLVSNVRTSD